MGEPYTVQPGDTLTSIAASHGFDSWQSIYFHDDNADFRRRRPNPNLIFPGDVLILPDREPPEPPPPEPPEPPEPPPEPPEPPPEPPPPEPDDDRPADGLYSAFWLFPMPRDEAREFLLSRQNLNTLSLQPGRKAVLLYPALFTPAVVADRQDVELLLLLHNSVPRLLPEDVNRQLKFGPSLALGEAKSFDPEPLFANLSADQIKIAELALTDGIIETPSRAFRGVVDERPLKRFKDAGFTRLFALTLHVSCLKKAQTASKSIDFERASETHRLRGGTENDKLVDAVLNELNSHKLPQRGKLTFAVTNDVQPGKTVDGDLIQAYHPIFYRRALHFANFAHMSDIHINARANILAKTNARVIDADDGIAPQSPDLGSLVNVPSRNTKEILDGIGSASSVADALLIGGDLMDYRRNVWPRTEPKSAGDVWRQVALDDDFNARYDDFVDFVSFFSLMIDFSRRSGKPIFGITGNHDCYGLPYGVSPRVAVFGKEVARANEGIPADHNLTIYEAMVAFGKTATVIKSTSLFEKDKLAWFYGVFTPFKDFCSQWPKQAVVALGWGNEEDLLDPPGTNHGLGHLPRADEPITGKQLALVDGAVASGKRVLMSTHFTAVSYREDQPMNMAAEGDVRFQSFLGLSNNEFDQGTFETNREPFYNTHLAGSRAIQCVISGHTHRRGLYLVTRIDRTGRSSIRTRYFDFTDFQRAMGEMGPSRAQPAIIVSDSAGPIPRHNARGEFNGFGSSAPAGTQLVFTLDSRAADVNGDLKMVTTLPASVRPRLAVTLDYMDIVDKREVMPGLVSDFFDPDDENRRRLPGYTFRLKLHPELVQLGIRFAEVRLFVNDTGTHWEALDLIRRSNTEWQITGRAQMRLFTQHIASVDPLGRFMSVKFASDNPFLRNQYDLDSAWNFEFNLTAEIVSKLGVPQVPLIGPLINFLGGTRKRYVIRRWVFDHPDPRCEKPNFSFRKRFAKYK